MEEQNNKNLKPCPSCGNMVSKKAKSCPSCGAKFKSKKALWIVLAVVAVVIVIIAASSGGNDSPTVEPASGDSTQSSQSTSAADSKVKPGNTLNANGVKITYKSVEVWKGYNEFSAPKSGNKVIRAYFEFENTNDYDCFVSSASFQCYADGSAADDYIFADDYLSTDTLSSGRKTAGYIYYEIPSDAKEIELEYEADFWSDKKIIFEVNV